MTLYFIACVLGQFLQTAACFGFGILVMAAVFLPLVIRLGLYLAALNLAAVTADILSLTRPAAVLRSGSSALSVPLGLVICYGMMILVSVTVVLLLGTGG